MQQLLGQAIITMYERDEVKNTFITYLNKEQEVYHYILISCGSSSSSSTYIQIILWQLHHIKM